MKLALLMWPDTFEDWYPPLGIDREAYLASYDGEWSITLSAALATAGAEVHVLFGTLGPPQVARQAVSGALTHFVPSPPACRALRRAAWGHRFWETTGRLGALGPVASTLSRRLVAALRRLKPDAVIVQDYEALRFDVAAPLLHAAGLTVVGLDTGGSGWPSTRPWKRWAAGRAALLLATHQGEAARARRDRGRPTEVWPAPVRTDVFRPGDRRAARLGLGLDPDARLVVSAGRLHPVKGLGDLVEACAGLDCTLALVGSGPQQAELEARRRPGLLLPGRTDAAGVARWYAAADVVALSSHREGLPVAVLEALACARPVVATAVGGVPDVVVGGRTGWLVPPGQPEALAAALEAALADPAEAGRRAVAGRELVLASHTPEAVGARMVGLLGTVSPADARRGRPPGPPQARSTSSSTSGAESTTTRPLTRRASTGRA